MSQIPNTKSPFEFVALIVRNRICNLLKEQMIRMETRQKYLTVPAAIRELEKIEMVRRNNGTYVRISLIMQSQRLKRSFSVPSALMKPT